MSKSNDKKSEQLSMPHGTACGKLRKSIVLHLLKQLNQDICFKCGERINTERELSIEHKVPYLDSKNPVELFFDLENVAFSHLSCNCGAARVVDHKYKKSQSGYKGVQVLSNRRINWRIKIKDKHYSGFSTAEEAARFYDEKVTELFGEKALTNKKLGLLN